MTAYTATQPVFYDQSGKRWRRICVAFTIVTVSVLGLLLWMTPRVLAPAWATHSDRPSNYPSQLLADDAQLRNMPVIGTEGVDAFTRIDLVARLGAAVWLLDPFSNAPIRQATPSEAQAIGDHPYALEWFGHPADHQLVLTFDDGPDYRNTPQILDILSREHVRATFFVVGKNALREPELVQRITREGHDIGNHTLNHVGFGNGTIRDREELVGTDKILRTIDGQGSRLFRIPEGDPDHNPLAVLTAQQLGYVDIDMDLDTRDWSYQPQQAIPPPSLDGKGHVVLMHDGGGNHAATIQLLPKLIESAKAQGYSFATVSDIMPAPYKTEHVAPSLMDRATWLGFWSILKLPNLLIGWLYWFGVGSLVSMSALYVSMALLNARRQHKRVWPSDYKPFVSVTIAAYNEEAVIAKTLDAIKQSRYAHYEVIVVDDGSSDNTWNILVNYAKAWRRLRIFHQENLGKAEALNRAIKMSRGEVIVSLDADTVFEPQTIGALARHFHDPRVGAVAGNIKVGNRRNVLTAWQSLEYISGICVTRMAEGFMGTIMIVPGACAGWRKQAVLKAGGYSSATQAEDCDLTLTIQALGYRITQENDAVAWTEAPMNLRSLAKQRVRWTFGNLQAFRKHRGLVLRPRYGVLGMIVLPYALVSLAVPLLFMPLTFVVAALNLANGNWRGIVTFALLVVVIHMVISAIGVAIAREKAWHLLVVPFYRLIYEPLRAYLLYATALRATKGQLVKWYRPNRTNSVVAA